MTNPTIPESPTSDVSSESDSTNPIKKKTLTLGNQFKSTNSKFLVEKEQVRQSFSHGKSKTVEVEIRRRRTSSVENKAHSLTNLPQEERPESLRGLTSSEVDVRLKAIKSALSFTQNTVVSDTPHELEHDRDDSNHLETQKIEIESLPVVEELPLIIEEIPLEIPLIDVPPVVQKIQKTNHGIGTYGHKKTIPSDFNEESAESHDRKKIIKTDKKVPVKAKVVEQPKKLNRSVITRVLQEDLDDRPHSLLKLKKKGHKHKQLNSNDLPAVIRDVSIPETIVVSDLANRMAVRSADVIKALMKLGLMVSVNQSIDGDTAELICADIGHRPIRVRESDLENSLVKKKSDQDGILVSRPPIVTVMGHVDHGKTSLLDALRKTNVVSTEAGGITQHIGAYQVTLESGKKITFIDTPGHAAFSEMRSRGAGATDIIILVVAADDGIKEQTLEAIRHAKSAGVPIIVAINKMDKPTANPDRVKQELLQHDIVVEDFGGDILAVPISATERTGLDTLEEAILLQAEILDLKSNNECPAQGVVIEARVDKGRGPIATVLIQSGTLKIGDIIVAGSEFGRVKLLMNDQGVKIESVTPATPVSVLGLSGVPRSGDELIVVDSESKAREVAEYRTQKEKNIRTSFVKGTIQEMLSRISSGKAKDLPIVIKGDTQGSVEAISTTLLKLGNSEVSVRILHSGVGGITESDVLLAKSSAGIIFGFNVRANPQARDIAKSDGIDIRYYSIIYNVLDDVKEMLSGLLAPTLREQFLGTAQIRTVFDITKIGKIAGCYITEGLVKRGGKVRLLRDNVVIHEGTLKTLKRFKEEVKEVKESYECGMAFENYHDIREGDMIECFEIESIKRTL